MTALHIRDVPAPVVATIRERAIRQGNTMQQELRAILEAAAAEPLPEADPPPLRLITTSISGTSRWDREEIYGDDGR